MSWRIAATIAILAALAPDLRAQQQAADSAWAAGNYATAKALYEQVLTTDPGSVRANYRLGILASWDNRLDSALVLLRHARQTEPGDPDVRVAEARILSWSGRYTEAIARYDSVIADYPDRVDAHVGLGQIYYWEDRLGLAREQAAIALRLDPRHRDANKLMDDVTGAGRVAPEVTVSWSHDSDDNNTWSQSVSASLMLTDGVRGFGSLGAFEASDPVRKSSRLSAEAGVRFGVSGVRLLAALGVRELLAGGAPDRTVPTWRAGASYQLTPAAGLDLSYAHFSFDETAFLIARDLDVDALDLGASIRLRPSLQLGTGLGHAWFSDGNSRTSGVLALTKALPKNFTAGIFGRMMGYEFHGTGYFSPDRLTVIEGRGSYGFSGAVWRGRIAAGLGVQQIGKGASAQLEGHIDGRVGRNWGGTNRVDFFAGFSTSAESSTTGAFRYYSAGILVTVGL